MARRRKPEPITAARVERAMDTLAWVMSKAGTDAGMAAPLYKRLEAELVRLTDQESTLDAARSRVTQLRDRMEAGSGHWRPGVTKR